MTEVPTAEGAQLAQAHRKRALGLAVVTSLFSKGGTIGLILIAMPLALHVLGPERFGVFGALQTLMWFMGMADFGIGAGLARRLTVATSMGDQAEQRRVMSTGFFMMTGVLLIVGLVGALVLWTVPVETLFGKNFGPYADELRFNLWLGGGIFLSLMIIGTALKTREANHEIHIFNLFGAVGNVLAAGLLFFGIKQVPEVWFLLVSIYGVQVVMWLLNALHAFRQRPWLWPRIGSFHRPLAGSLVMQGMGFFVLLGVTPILGREMIRWLLGQYYTPTEVGHFTILAQFGYFIFGMIFMITYPLSPALVDATARQDHAWIRRMNSRLTRLGLAGVVLGPLVMALVGPALVRLWFQMVLPLGPMELGAYGLFFMLTVWTHLHCVMLAGLGKIRAAAGITALEGVVVCVGAWIGVRSYGMVGACFGGAAAMLLTSFLLFPRLLRQSVPSASVS